jgi:hypothetical protein
LDSITPEQIERAKNVVEIEPEEYEAYRLAMDAFVLANQDAVLHTPDVYDFKNRKDELKRKLLGDRYVERIKVRCTVTPVALPQKPAFANLGTKPWFSPEPATREEREYRAGVSACRNWLVKTFPNAFFLNSQPKKTLSLHIIADIAARFNMTGNERDLLRHAVNLYRNSPGYCEAMVLGAERIGLGGKAIGYVVEDDPDYDFIAKRRTREAEQRARIQAEPLGHYRLEA